MNSDLRELERLERYCDDCNHLNEDDEIKRVGPSGKGSWACGRCLRVLYGVDRSRAQVFRLLHGDAP